MPLIGWDMEDGVNDWMTFKATSQSHQSCINLMSQEASPRLEFIIKSTWNL